MMENTFKRQTQQNESYFKSYEQNNCGVITSPGWVFHLFCNKIQLIPNVKKYKTNNEETRQCMLSKSNIFSQNKKYGALGFINEGYCPK